MAKNTIYVGLEIGTSKVCFVVGEVQKDGALRFLGYGTAPSRGVSKGEIVESALIEKALSEALIQAEDRSEVMIRHVYLGVTGVHIKGVNSNGILHLPPNNNVITEEDVADVREKACSIEIPSTDVFVHRLGRKYKIDDQDQVRSLVGREGSKLEASYHVVHAVRSRILNSINAVRNVPLEVEDVVFLPIAASHVVLPREAKEHGALMIDIGAGTTDYVLYRDGMITASGSIPLGGNSITNDIAQCFQVSAKLAEKLKINRGTTRYSDVDPEEVIKVKIPNEARGKELSVTVFNEVIYLRTHEILNLVRERCKGHLSHLGAGVYLTGGSSYLRGIDEVARSVFKMKVTRVGEAPGHAESLSHNPLYSACVGLIRHAQMEEAAQPHRNAFQRALKKFTDIFN